MFDGFLNAALCEEVPPLGLHKGILNSLYLLILLIHTKHKNNKMKSCADPISTLVHRGILQISFSPSSYDEKMRWGRG